MPRCIGDSRSTQRLRASTIRSLIESWLIHPLAFRHPFDFLRFASISSSNKRKLCKELRLKRVREYTDTIFIIEYASKHSQRSTKSTDRIASCASRKFLLWKDAKDEEERRRKRSSTIFPHRRLSHCKPGSRFTSIFAWIPMNEAARRPRTAYTKLLPARRTVDRTRLTWMTKKQRKRRVKMMHDLVRIARRRCRGWKKKA